MKKKYANVYYDKYLHVNRVLELPIVECIIRYSFSKKLVIIKHNFQCVMSIKHIHVFFVKFILIN